MAETDAVPIAGNGLREQCLYPTTMNSVIAHSMNSAHTIPEIIPIVLKQLASLRAAHQLAEEEFQRKLDRLRKEELDRRGLALLVRDLSDSHTRFIIKDRASESVVDMLECT